MFCTKGKNTNIHAQKLKFNGSGFDINNAFGHGLGASFVKEIALSHVDTCGDCGSCGGGKRKTIFGKEFARVCGCTFRIDNPDVDDLLFLKKMIEIRKSEIMRSINSPN